MRLALVIYGDPGQRTGGYLYDRMLARGLETRGARVEIVSLPEVSYPRRLTQSFGYAPLRARLAGRPAFDVVLEDELVHPTLAFGASPVSGRHRVSIVHNLASSGPRFRGAAPGSRAIEWARRAIERRYLRRAEAMILNSEDTRRDVARLVGSLPPHVIAHPAADHVFQRAAKPTLHEIWSRAHARPVRLISVGNLGPLKGFHLLLPALAQMRTSTPWSLEIVGSLERDREYVRQLRRQVVALGLDARVQLTGELAEEAVVARLRAASIFVLPSPREGFGIATVEAMGLGLAVVASTRGASPELIRSGVEGVLVDPHDPGAWATALSRLVDAPVESARLGVAAMIAARARPTWADASTRVADFLEALLDRRTFQFGNFLG